MKFTYSWLTRHLETKASLKEIGDTLTRIGLELEGMENPGEKFAPFTVAYVKKAEQHPDADKLKVCEVETKDGTFQVICGAPNARTGIKAIFAPEGSYVPGIDLTLRKTKIRGVESCGMLVSEREMQLSDEHEGIIEVDEKVEIGTPMADIFGLNDPVFEIGLTPNRADCAGVYGIARDLAAAGLGTLKPVAADPVRDTFKSPVGVKIEDRDGCPLFLGRYIKGVKNGPSPEWLQNLLKAVGQRPISALVDITNFLSLDHARPLHVYDADRLQGDIVVREGKRGEAFDALNDKRYELLGRECAITDDSGLLGLGGIVGGTSTGSEDATANVFLECAYFNPERIARTGRDLGIESDARYRFERGVDSAFTFIGMEMATRLILELCGGEASQVVQAGTLPQWEKRYEFDPAYTLKLAGVDVPQAQQKEILEALGFTVNGKGPWQVDVPPWRGDIMGAADLTEEVVRIFGYEHIPSVSVRSIKPLLQGAETSMSSLVRRAKTALAARGLHECVTWSFMNKDLAQHFGTNDNVALTIANPISAEMDQMRPSILPHLIEAARRNHDQGHPNAGLCEVGPTFQGTKPDGQKIVAAGVRMGENAGRHWADVQAARPVDLYDVKADAIAALEACGAPGETAQITRDAPDYFHPGRSGALRLGPNVLAYFGEIHPAVLQVMDVRQPVSAFEIFLDNVPAPKKKAGLAKPLLKLEPLQPVQRDFSFVVDKNVEAETLIRAVKAADKKLITDAAVFDVYSGKGVEEGKKSVAINVTIQPQGQTLKDIELDKLMQKVIDTVAQKAGAVLRA